MKKLVISIILVLALLMSFASCSSGNEGDLSNSESTSQQLQPPNSEETVYDMLNKLSKQAYNKIQLNITTFTGDIELEASYTLTANNITYSIEQLNLLPSDGDLSNTSPSYKTTIQGSAEIENGKVTKLDDVAVNLPEYDELKGAFDFKESYFKNVQVENGTFSADVIAVSSFLGADQNLSEMKIVVGYSASVLTTISITYQTSNSTVTAVYGFEK